jgi:hypothetical protein
MTHLHVPSATQSRARAADDRIIVSEPFSDLPGVWQAGADLAGARNG